MRIRAEVPVPVRQVPHGAAAPLSGNAGALDALLSVRPVHRSWSSVQRRARLMPLVEVRHLVKQFTRSEGLLSKPSVVRAVNDVSFTVEEGETFGLVGESGSGK